MDNTFATRIWDSYCSKPAIIDKHFLSAIPWHELGRPPADIISVIRYMRDIEMYSNDIFFDELTRTPSGRDPIIGQFIKRWSQEEKRHGELFSRMLEHWEADNHAYRRPPTNWRTVVRDSLICMLENACGEHFKTLHMVWGGINELATKEGYRALIKRWDDPVFTMILRAIIQEEGRHAGFYLQMAALRLDGAPLAGRFCRWMVKRFWRPVGQWDKTPVEIAAVIELFRKNDFNAFENNVATKIRTHLEALRPLDLTQILRSQLAQTSEA